MSQGKSTLEVSCFTYVSTCYFLTACPSKERTFQIFRYDLVLLTFNNLNDLILRMLLLIEILIKSPVLFAAR